MGTETGAAGDFTNLNLTPEQLAAQANALISGTSTSTRQPIGVPSDYRVRIPGAPVDYGSFSSLAPRNPFGGGGFRTQTEIRPQYYYGDEWEPRSRNPDEIKALQKILNDLGLYREAYADGIWQSQDADAYSAVLGNANGNGLDAKTMLTQMMAAPKVQLPKTPRKPLTVTLSHPDDINALIDNVGDKLYGGHVPDATRAAIVAAIQGSQRAEQEASYAMDETGGTVTAAPDPQTIATQQIRRTHPNEVAATQFSDMFDGIMSTFASSAYDRGPRYP